jgi:hypothetical protein
MPNTHVHPAPCAAFDLFDTEHKAAFASARKTGADAGSLSRDVP